MRIDAGGLLHTEGQTARPFQSTPHKGDEAVETKPQVNPEVIMKYATGAWVAGILGAAVQHRVFTLLESASATTEDLATRAAISRRGAQALLDGLLGLGLIQLDRGHYSNSAEASTFLVEDKPTYMGGFMKCEGLAMEQWVKLGEAVRTGEPQSHSFDAPAGFFEDLVPAIAPLSMPAAEVAVKELKLANAGAISILDVGGGSGIYSAIFLKANRQAKSTQLDFPSINRLARQYVQKYGVAERFNTIDGDFHVTDLGKAAYDVVVYSHIAHQESPESNIDLFKRIRAALKPGGSLVINDFVVQDDRSGPPFALIFHANMFVKTKGGATYRAADYRAFLQQAGFGEPRFVNTPGPSSLVISRR